MHAPRVIDGRVPRPRPMVDDATRPFWTGGADGQLLIRHCARCDRWIHPPVEICAVCGGALEPRPVSGHGTVFSWTINEQPFDPQVPTPYNIAIVVLDEQDDLRLITNIVNCPDERLEIGLAVQVLFERHADVYVPLFEPTDAT
ncbi:MAG: OB-fold domain-containing protein [Acidimicrobiales bacterium]|nr:OB-fold domain-containing protein [Acidimicrobiales bacterium]